MKDTKKDDLKVKKGLKVVMGKPELKEIKKTNDTNTARKEETNRWLDDGGS